MSGMSPDHALVNTLPDKCEQCGVEFERRSRKQRFCSYACNRKWFDKQRVGVRKRHKVKSAGGRPSRRYLYEVSWQKEQEEAIEVLPNVEPSNRPFVPPTDEELQRWQERDKLTRREFAIVQPEEITE